MITSSVSYAWVTCFDTADATVTPPLAEQATLPAASHIPFEAVKVIMPFAGSLFVGVSSKTTPRETCPTTILQTGETAPHRTAPDGSALPQPEKLVTDHPTCDAVGVTSVFVTATNVTMSPGAFTTMGALQISMSATPPPALVILIVKVS